MQRSLLIAMLSISVVSFADTSIKKVTENWWIIYTIDNFTDKKYCSVVPASTKRTGLIISVSHPTGRPPLAFLSVADNIDGAGLKYRIDNNKHVLTGAKNPFIKLPFVTGQDFKQMILDFKKGNNLIYEVISSNRYIDNLFYKTSLKGFSEAYNLAEKCNF